MLARKFYCKCGLPAPNEASLLCIKCEEKIDRFYAKYGNGNRKEVNIE
jgi:hypothetical protein